MNYYPYVVLMLTLEVRHIYKIPCPGPLKTIYQREKKNFSDTI